MPATTLMPDPWIPDTTSLLEPLGAPTLYASVAWPSANLAIYMPVVFPADCTIYSMSVVGNNTTGNYDLGFYSPLFTRIASKGSTAMSAAVLTLSIGDYRVRAGDIYFAAVTCSGAGAIIMGGIAAVFGMVTGFAQQATALPLPATGTPATFAQAVYPLVSFGVR